MTMGYIRPALAATAALLLTPLALTAQTKHALTFEDFAAMHGVSDPQISPDGQRVLYLIRVTDLPGNRRVSNTWIVRVDGTDGHAFPEASTHATEARWSPDGRRIAYIAGGQLWIADVDGGNRHQLTNLNGGATGPVWSPLGNQIAFTSATYPDCSTDACNVMRDSVKNASKVKAHIADELMFRHWNAWDEGTRSHLYVVSTEGGPPRDLTPNARYDVPPGPFGGSEGYSWSPDGQELAFSAKDAGKQNAWSTDINLYVVRLAGGGASVITASNTGADENPVYTPDGKFIAYQSQKRAGFESDRWRLMLYDRRTRQSRELLPAWDRNADAYYFPPDMRSVYVTGVDASRNKLFRFTLDANAMATGTPIVAVEGNNNTAFSFSHDGAAIAWLRDAANRPAEVYVARVGTRGSDGVRALSHENDDLIRQIAVNPAEDYWFRGANNDSVQGFIIKPPDWAPGKTYPVVLLVHGGPQGEWLDQWHSRWNYQMFAAPGNALVIINPHGSFGYGQKFVDAVSRDWGGATYRDLMLGLTAALKRNPWMDSTRMGAAGGSYGGYMVNWIAGHTNRFKALVSHAGPYNLEAMYGATEEIWFPEWEYGGPYWNPQLMATQYRKFSPHLFAKNFRTPTLVLNGELDYRVPYTEGLQMFTALQRQGVPSRLVVFPDEGHWILKPQNAQLWWREVQGWLTRYMAQDKPRL